MALEGEVKTPFGQIHKQTAVYLGAFVVVLGGIVWYRHKQAAANTPAVSTDGEIDPATGFPYGSAEDLAALQSQGNTAMPISNTGGGSSASSDTPIHPSTNDQWTQKVLADLQANNLSDAVPNMTAALGKYLTGSYATDNDVALIQQAIALEGQPPVPGATGYPPSINRNPPNSTGGTGGTSGGGSSNNDPTLPAPSGLHIVRTDEYGVSLDWEPVNGAIGYKTFVNGQQVGNSVVYSNAYVGLPKRKTSYTVGVQAINVKNRTGHTAAVRVTTK